MRQIINFIITGLILWGASKLFPNTVEVAGFGTLVLATVLLYVVQILIVLITFVFMAFSAVTENWFGVIIGFVAIFGSEIIAMSILSSNLDGFSINGFWAKVVLAIVLSACQIPSKSSD